MKPYTVNIDINLPRDKVIELFDDPDNLYKWQEGLQSFEHISGEPGQPGAKSRLVFKIKNRTLEMTETITARRLPDAFNGTYEWAGGKNTLDNRFIELSPTSTRWESTCSYTFTSLSMKIMAALFPGMLRKQNMKFLQAFKAFCEEGRDVRAPAAPKAGPTTPQT